MFVACCCVLSAVCSLAVCCVACCLLIVRWCIFEDVRCGGPLCVVVL